MMQTVNGLVSIRKTTGGGQLSFPTVFYSGQIGLVPRLQSKYTDLHEFTDELPLGDKQKLIDCFRIEGGSGMSSMQVFIGTKARLVDSPTVNGPYTLTADDEMVFPSPRIPEARYFNIEIVDTQPSVVWSITAIELYGVVRGQGKR